MNTKNHTHRIVWPPVRRPRFAKTTSSRARAVYARFRIFPPSLLPSLWLAPTHLTAAHVQPTNTDPNDEHARVLSPFVSLSGNFVRSLLIHRRPTTPPHNVHTHTRKRARARTHTQACTPTERPYTACTHGTRTDILPCQHLLTDKCSSNTD